MGEQEAFHMKLYSYMCGGARPSPGRSRTISPNLFVPHRPAGTHAYMISLKGAETLRRLCPKARYHVDLLAWGQPELRLYAARDFLATQRFGNDTTVSRDGLPWTEDFLRWCWTATGSASMLRRGGLPNLTWAWKTAVFALPIPYTRQRIIVEMGPSSSLSVVLCVLAVTLRMPKLFGVSLVYVSSVSTMIRWLSGERSYLPPAVTAAAGAAVLWFA